MIKPSNDIIDAVAPAYELFDLPISDGYSVRNVAHAETRDTLRLPRGGDYDATLVAVKKFYDGANGGEAGHYVLMYVEFRATQSRWRTVGVKIRQEEAGRIARALVKRDKVSKPGRNEDERVGGREMANTDSELWGAPVNGGAYALFVRSLMRGDKPGRSRGVVIRAPEAGLVAEFLTALAKIEA